MADQGALGLIETRGLVAALEAADAASKAASVKLVGIKKTNPALMTVQVTGETAAVRSAVDAGKAAAERVGQVVATHVIPRPADDIVKMQTGATPARRAPAKKAAPARPAPTAAPKSAPAAAKPAPAKPAPAAPKPRPATLAAPPEGDLESMTVRELRALARSMDGLSIQGREIARANKAELLRALGR